MALKKSPGGSIFPYYYKNGELFGLHLGSFGSDGQGVIERMQAEQLFIAQQGRNIPVWMDFYQTALTDEVVACLIEMLVRIHHLVPKICFVGCSNRAKRKIKKLMAETASLAAVPARFFKDPEDAKTWLVSENSL